VLGDMLVLDKGRVIWYGEGGNKHIRQFSCEVEPLDAIFCSFPSITDENGDVDIAVAILMKRDHLRLHQTNGEHFDVHLEFEVGCMFATIDGLLLQSTTTFDETEEKTLGHLYALPHPVTLPRPVTMLVSASMMESETSMSIGGKIDDAEGGNTGNGHQQFNAASPVGKDGTHDAKSFMSFESPADGGAHNESSVNLLKRGYTRTSTNDRVVAVRENVVVTCHPSGEEGGDSVLNMWILQPMLAPADDGGGEGGGENMSDPNRFGDSGAFRSIGLMGKSANSMSSLTQQQQQQQSLVERGESPSLAMFLGNGSPTEVLENALGVSSNGAFNSRLDSNSMDRRSPVQHLQLLYPGSIDPIISNSERAEESIQGPANHSMLSGFSANSAKDESYAVINALHHAELSLVLVDTAPLSLKKDECKDVDVQITGHPHAVGGLIVQVLHQSSGFHRMYSVNLSTIGEGVEQRQVSGSLRAVGPVQFPRPPVSLAYVAVPLGLPSDATQSLVTPLTVALLQDDDDTAKMGTTAAVLIGETYIGEMLLRWENDLDIDKLLGDGPSTGGSNHHANSNVRALVTSGSPGTNLVIHNTDGYHIVSLPPALLLDPYHSRCCLEMVSTLLAELQALATTDNGDSREDRHIFVTVAESVIGLVVLSEVVLGPASGICLVVHALFGSPMDTVPQIEKVLSSANRSVSEETRIVSLYNSIVAIVKRGGDDKDDGRVNLRVVLFDALHATIEDLLVRGINCQDKAMEGLINTMATCVRDNGGKVGAMYFDHYQNCLGMGFKIPGRIRPNNYEIEFTRYRTEVPSAIRWIVRCLQSIEEAMKPQIFDKSEDDDEDMIIEGGDSPRAPTRFPVFYVPTRLRGTPNGMDPCPTLRVAKKFFKSVLLRASMHSSTLLPSEKARVVADSYANIHVDKDLQHLKLLPPILRVVVELALYQCRSHPNMEWSDSVFEYIGRDDLCRYQRDASVQINPTVYDSHKATSGGSSKKASDGLDEVEAAASLRFAEDDRMREACRMLRSSNSIYLRLEKAPDTSDLDHRHQLQLRLLSLCRRSLACSVGRGMLTLGSLEPLIAEALPVPPLNLTGRVPPNNAIVQLDTASAPTELTLWPDFHNGVAAGLRVGLGAGRGGGPSAVKITRYWIIYNRTAASAAAAAALAAKSGNNATSNNVSTESAISSHAGVLLALGLQGHLSVLSKGDICDYLIQGHEPTTIAMLLGIAASKIGTADSYMSKTLCLYLPTLLPPRHWDISISPLVQTAALAGLGLLHAGSGHRLITEFLLAELSRRPLSDRCDNRETMALSASWALGLVLLGKGGSGSSSGGSGGMEGLVDLRIDDRLCQLFTGGKKPEESHLFPSAINPIADGGSRASRILEGDDINTDLTGPGALIALSLIYIKSNNAEIARRMALPETVHSLDSVRPDLLLYRALGICLIMWNSVEPSEQWIDAQVPEVVKKTLFPEKFGSLDREAPFLPSKHAKQLALRDALHLYMCTVSGYCFGMGLVYAGTSDKNAKEAILSKLKFLQSIRDNRLAIEPPLILDRSIKPLVDMCVSVVAVSLSVVMAGTGDVDCLRTIRELRWRVDEVNHGTHLALSMSIGMLFLAGGNASVKKDPLSIACLLLSMCPRFPSRTIDNQYHLQAFRHMYVIAIENRVLKTVDVDSGEPVPVTVDMEMKDGRDMTIWAPCLLPELDSIAALRVNVKKDSSSSSCRSNDMDVAGANIDGNRKKKLDLFCSHLGGHGNQRIAQDLYSLELLFAAPRESDAPSDTRSGNKLLVNPHDVQNLKVKKKHVDRFDPTNTARTLGHSFQPSLRLQKTLTDFYRARDPADSPTLPEKPDMGNEMLQEVFMQMLESGNDSNHSASHAEATLCQAVEASPLLRFI
jgi:hypothetical protein